MSLIPFAGAVQKFNRSGGGGAAGYQIERSLRFNSADSAYLNRTPASAGNRRTWTWSGWVKRSAFGGTQSLFARNDGSVASYLIWNSDNKLEFSSASGSVEAQVITTPVYRDASAWYHVTMALDTTQGTSSNRVKLYINGVQVTALDTASYPSQNYDGYVNTTQIHYIGAGGFGGSLTGFFNGYLTEVNFIDGQALDPTSFGEFNATTGVWQPIEYTGSYGTNGFYLNFSDNSGTTSTTLGKDQAGSNNWTPNNFSVTAGAGNDSLVDTPTPYGTDTGAGGTVRGNYATLNPLDNGNSNILLTNGNLSVSSSTTWDRGVKGTFGVASGKWYYEYTHGTVNAGTNPAAELGWTKYPSLINSYLNGGYGSADTYLVQGSDGTKWNNGSGSAYGSAFTTGDVEMCAIDMDNGKVYWGKNGTWFASGDPAAGTNAAFTGLSGTFFPLWYWGLSAGTGGVLISNINFGQRPFAYTAPSGFKALCTQNLPEPTIVDGGEYFNTVLYEGDYTTSHAITGVGFQPDLVWIKDRGLTTIYNYSHLLYDAVRGAGKELRSNSTGAETDNGTGTSSPFRSFDSDGFTVGQSYSSNEVDPVADFFVSWNWKANGAGVTNTAGTTSATVSVNTTSGFSIITATTPSTYTSHTVGHGLGVTPAFIIYKERNQTSNWQCWHKSLSGATNLIQLNTTSAEQSGGFWETHTSTVIACGGGIQSATSSPLVMYAFAPVAGYSAFGSYTGNGSTDGSFVYLGFRPRWILLKNITTGGPGYDWFLYDSARDTYNVSVKELEPNLSVAEDAYGTSTTGVDLLSNGFKMRTSGAGFNGSGDTYIYAAFAENPFKYALAR